MRRPAKVTALVELFGNRDAVTDAENGWWSFCPVTHQNGDGPVYCGEPMFIRAENGSIRFEPVCGHTAATIAAAIDAVPLDVPATNATGPSHLTDFTEIVAKPVRWAWQDRAALAKITASAGRPKIGKGLLYAHLIAQVTRGELPGDLDGPRNAILVTTEDEPGDTIKPRLMAAGADLSRVSIFQMGSKDEPVPFRVPQDAAELGRRVEEKQAALVVIDPLMEFIDGKVDSHKSHPVRQAIAALNQIAREHGCAALVVLPPEQGRVDRSAVAPRGVGGVHAGCPRRADARPRPRRPGRRGRQAACAGGVVIEPGGDRTVARLPHRHGPDHGRHGRRDRHGEDGAHRRVGRGRSRPARRTHRRGRADRDRRGRGTPARRTRGRAMCRRRHHQAGTDTQHHR